MDEVNRYWAAFKRYEETAEQHEFVNLLRLESLFAPAYNDLCKNYDEGHATIFIRGMKGVFKTLGIKLEETED